MDWTTFWQQSDFWCGAQLPRINAGRFLRVSAPLIGFAPTDRVLSVGCGPGHLEALLAPEVASIAAADVSEECLQRCARNCRGNRNVTLHRLGADYTDLTACGGPFSVFLCISVVQYYSAPSEIEALARSARAIAAPGARMWIGDLPLRRRPWGRLWDLACGAMTSAASGYAAAFAVEGLRWRMHCRRRARAGGMVPSLEFGLREIHELAARLPGRARVVRRSVSVYPNRPSIFLELPGAA